MVVQISAERNLVSWSFYILIFKKISAEHNLVSCYLFIIIQRWAKQIYKFQFLFAESVVTFPEWSEGRDVDRWERLLYSETKDVFYQIICFLANYDRRKKD